MKDKWMNMGYEEDELKPYVEPEPDFKDLKRIGEYFFVLHWLINFFFSVNLMLGGLSTECILF